MFNSWIHCCCFCKVASLSFSENNRSTKDFFLPLLFARLVLSLILLLKVLKGERKGDDEEDGWVKKPCWHSKLQDQLFKCCCRRRVSSCLPVLVHNRSFAFMLSVIFACLCSIEAPPFVLFRCSIRMFVVRCFMNILPPSFSLLLR